MSMDKDTGMNEKVESLSVARELHTTLVLVLCLVSLVSLIPTYLIKPCSDTKESSDTIAELRR